MKVYRVKIFIKGGVSYRFMEENGFQTYDEI